MLVRSRVSSCSALHCCSLQTGSCRFNDSCKYAHVPGAKPGEDVSARAADDVRFGKEGFRTDAEADAEAEESPESDAAQQEQAAAGEADHMDTDDKPQQEQEQNTVMQ